MKKTKKSKSVKKAKVAKEKISKNQKVAKKDTQKPIKDKTQRKARKGTAKELVIKLLNQKSQTRDSLAEAIIESKLTANKTAEKVKNYVSVMLSNLKREGTKLDTGKRGVYRIKK